MTVSGMAFPIETAIALVLVVSGPVLAVLLHLVDNRRGNGEISIAGRR